MLAQGVRELLTCSIEQGIKDFLTSAHIQDPAAMDSLLTTWCSLESPNLLDAAEYVFPSLEDASEC
jgi:hypothetical protein